MVPLILMAAGTVMQMGGQYAANMEQARLEKQNAKFYEEQAEFARVAAMRQEAIAGFEYTHRIGEQIGNYAASGVDAGSGSAAITIGGTVANALNEIWSIKKKGDIETKLARLRGVQSADTAKMLSSGGYNLMQGAGTLLNNYANTQGFGTLKKGA